MNHDESTPKTRRSLLSHMGALSIGAYCFPVRAWGSPGLAQESAAGGSKGGEAMDEALEMLAPYGPSYRGGLSNHGPMAVEALTALGRDELVKDWVENYRRRLEPRPAATERVSAEGWRDALGDKARVRDWEDLFANELAESPWREVVGVWVPRLAPGIAAAGLHGVIRVGHAVCSLHAKENDLRRDELARALAYWASEYLALPGAFEEAGDLSPANALSKVERLPDELRASRGLITTELKDLVGFEPFVQTIGLVDPTAGEPGFVPELLGTSAGTLTNTRSGSFEFLHAVTGTAAIAEILPLVPKDEHAEVLAYTWQVTAAVYSRYAAEGLVAEVEGKSDEALEPLTQFAAETGDEHTIKLAAACSRGWHRHPDPRLLTAIAGRNERHR